MHRHFTLWFTIYILMNGVAMVKWMDQLQNAKTDLKLLASSKNSKEFEQKMEAMLEKLSTNPQFLSALSLLLNTQSQLKSFMNFSFEKIWKNIQLPNKKDQERTLYLLHELQYKIHQVEKEMARLRALPSSELVNRKERQTETRPITVLNKQKTDMPVSKLV